MQKELNEQKEHHRIELQHQQVFFDQQKALLNEQLAEAVADASNQKCNYDSCMARAALDASDMKKAFERLSCDNAGRKKAELAATKVRTRGTPSGTDLAIKSDHSEYNFTLPVPTMYH